MFRITGNVENRKQKAAPDGKRLNADIECQDLKCFTMSEHEMLQCPSIEYLNIKSITMSNLKRIILSKLVF